MPLRRCDGASWAEACDSGYRVVDSGWLPNVTILALKPLDRHGEVCISEMLPEDDLPKS